MGKAVSHLFLYQALVPELVQVDIQGAFPCFEDVTNSTLMTKLVSLNPLLCPS